jgi:hypothetical protein
LQVEIDDWSGRSRRKINRANVSDGDLPHPNADSDGNRRNQNGKWHLPAQPVDATHALNLSAGVSNCEVSHGRSLS